jgi:hypothetical protein
MPQKFLMLHKKEETGKIQQTDYERQNLKAINDSQINFYYQLKLYL